MSEFPLTDLLNRNMQAVREALKVVTKRSDELAATVEAQNQKISTLDQEVKALRQEVVLARLSSAGSGPTT